jgi:hypothetical protein
MPAVNCYAEIAIISPPFVAKCGLEPVADSVPKPDFDGLDGDVERLAHFGVPEIKIKSAFGVMPRCVEVSA